MSVGILPGLWLYLGVDPEAKITYVVLDQICQFISSIVGTGAQSLSDLAFLIYTIIGVVTAIFTWVGIYQIGGGWSVAAVLAAFAGGCLIGTPFGIWLILGALAVAPFLPVDREHSLDEPW